LLYEKETTMIPTARKRFLKLLTVLAFGLSAAGASSALAHQDPPAKAAESKELGTFLVDAKGMTLYVFDNDKESGMSTCTEGCAKAWPPFAPKAGAHAPPAPFSIITRADDSKQYAYKGKPLYHYVKDKKPGDTTGHGVGQRWWVAKP
jgi:predicted lipoprotein with Yx(FWY)xxD motif